MLSFFVWELNVRLREICLKGRERYNDNLQYNKMFVILLVRGRSATSGSLGTDDYTAPDLWSIEHIFSRYKFYENGYLNVFLI